MMTWSPAFRVKAAATTGPTPPAFPIGIDLYRQAFRNWVGEIVVDDVWTCAPVTPQQVADLANWARGAGWRLRARGAMHGFSPLTITRDEATSPVVLLDTTQHLTRVTLSGGPHPTVTAELGVLMDDLLALMGSAGLGFLAVPAVGDITLGGALAIDGHGTAVPALGEVPPPGHSYGSLSNLVTSITAVAWNPNAHAYELRTLSRSDPDAPGLLAHLGRGFVTGVTMQVISNHRLRCRSYTDIPAAELMAPASSTSPRRLDRFLDEVGRAEIIWFPFTANPWFKTWGVSPTKPPQSRPVSRPYNYAFADNIPLEVSDLARQAITGNPGVTPAYCQAAAAAAAAGLTATLATDLWGWSKDVLVYSRPTTIRYAVNGYALHTRRSDVQRVVHDLYDAYSSMVAAAAARGEFPMNGPIELRVTGLDQPADSIVPGATAPSLSALRPRLDHPDWDTAVWFDALTWPGTPGAAAFYAQLEDWIFGHFTPPFAGCRVEWSKGFAYSDRGAWTNATRLRGSIPGTFPDDPGQANGWNGAIRRLDALDPHRVFSNPLLDTLLQQVGT